MSDRGSGRTTRQLAALPDGGVYLVAHRPMASHCERLLMLAGRARSAITFVTPDLAEKAVCDRRPSAWDRDHAYFEIARRDRAKEAYDLLWMAAGKGPLATE